MRLIHRIKHRRARRRLRAEYAEANRVLLERYAVELDYGRML